MEVDIELCLSNVSDNNVAILAKNFIVRLQSNGKNESNDIVVRQSEDNINGIVDQITHEFLASFDSYINIVKLSDGVLRIGVFYSLEESVVFPFRLTSQTLSLIVGYNLAIDVTGYPCSEDD